jgi:Tol biopolymer transport system component/DNA-binding SARP family transcriptional activator
VVSGSAAQPRRLAVLALLATAGEQGLTREKVLAYLWPDTEEERARRGLNQALYALRQDLGSDDVFVGTRDLRLNTEIISSDVGEFEQALKRGKLEEAAGRYTGPFLDGFHLPGAPEFERWAEEERAVLARCYAESLEKLAKRSEEGKDWSAAVGWWRKVAAQDPLNARVAVRLMRGLVAAGDRAGALQHARVYEVLMEQELDAPPDQQVVELAQELRRNETPPAAPATPTARIEQAVPEPIVLATQPAETASPERVLLDTVPAAIAPTPLVPSAAAEPLRTRPARSHGHLPQLLGAILLLIAGITAGLIMRDRGTSDLIPGSTRRVAFDQQLELDPAISPDGRMMAYSAEVGDRFHLFVKQIRGGRAVSLTDALPGSHRRPQWSPDGNEIAFQAERAIYLVDAFGGVPRLLVKARREEGWVAYPTWSPDGRFLAYVEDWAIYTRPIDGGQPRLITREPAAHSLSWSPDGKWIAFVSGNPVFSYGELPWGSPTNLGNIAPSSIWVVPASGGEPVRVTDAQSLNTSPVWLPKSHGLLFISDLGGSRDIYRVNLTRSGSAAGSPGRLTTGLSAHSISLSADAKDLAYSAFTYTGNVWALPIPSRGEASWAQAQPLTEGTQTIEGLALSPDGRWLAFDSDRDGNQDLYKMSVTGGEPVRLTHSPEADFVSTWSGDGRVIALHSYMAGTRRVRLVSSEGGEPRDIIPSPSNQRSPDMSTDGRRMVFTADVRGQPQLFLVSPSSDTAWGTASQLTSAGGWAGRWSPDGSTIVYCRSDGLWLSTPGGGNDRHLLDVGRTPDQPSPELAQWSGDGRTIYYKAFDAVGHSSFWEVPAAGGAPRLLVRFDDPAHPSTRPEFATDGKRLFFTMGVRQSDIWAMELKAQR